MYDGFEGPARTNNTERRWRRCVEATRQAEIPTLLPRLHSRATHLLALRIFADGTDFWYDPRRARFQISRRQEEVI